MNTKNLAYRIIATAVVCVATLSINAAEVVYRIVEYNKTIGDFTLAASGSVPHNSWAYFENDFGATTGNRYNQIPRNRKASLVLQGWQGCRIKNITLSMCSNNKEGEAALVVADGETTVYTEAAAEFSSDKWFGRWVSKDLGVYVDVTRQLDLAAFTSDEAVITVKGGTAKGSVYLDAITIEYDAPEGASLESPLGWSYEKLEAKGTLNEGDQLMIFRNGCAAADIDGMEKSQYLDVVALANTTDVSDPDVLRFKLAKGETAGCWTLTDQFGRRLGATAKGKLAWNAGDTQWKIELGYQGATITSATAAYGTLRFNEPESSYARFGLYTSKTLPLPFLYRRTTQQQPVAITSIDFGASEQSASIDQSVLALRPELKPSKVTDRRLVWTTDNADVATVNGGLVMLNGVGEATITATSHDGGAKASILIKVTASTGISTTVAPATASPAARKVIDGNRVVIIKGDHRYSLDGRQQR